MDFNHRRDDDRTSTYFTSSASRDGYFTEQALLRAIQRELEKERIREEIIAAERRALEREVLLERELALQRRGHAHGFSLMASSASMLRADQRLSLMVHPHQSYATFPTRAEAGMYQGEGARLEERFSWRRGG
ncbi:hypothetical protein NE237_032333 [Protea cynaroides]|uniref:Uncharacterized protein n=1 Tax=Protea cynaroides TaxID=273540 RepID=A0A9Q0L3T7_9MAGN|nr:hypothetical protein NE237_032333 [Protea cynaroides]